MQCWALSQLSRDSKPTCNLLGPLIGDEDLIPVGTIEVKQSGDYLIVITAKNNALMFHTIKFDGNGMQVFNESFIVFPSLQISGNNIVANLLLFTTKRGHLNKV